MSQKKATLMEEFLRGIWKENPILISLLGLCPTLAVTVSAENGLAMGLAATFVVISSSMLVSLLRNIIPSEVRIASFIVIIATFVTIADRYLAAYFPEISANLGPFIPLIIVNCMILGRQEAFASKNNILRSALDAIGVGIGFTLVLVVLGGVREILGSGTLFGAEVMWSGFHPWAVMILPPGAFLALGLMIGVSNWLNELGEKK
ncbi:MAG: electron transport complex subunit E [Candidatus Marinimicrobia bacterium]|nr:electron transport complex subunit E [Candidatus Neomarinimicrobiota bacterium]